MSQAYVAISQDRGTCSLHMKISLATLMTDNFAAVGVQGDARVYGFIAM